jgi:hypothetical protein
MGEKMLKNLSIVLIALLAAPVLGAALAPNASSDGTFELNHKVDRASSFKLHQDDSNIATSGTIPIGYVKIKNNTRDGFRVFLVSESSGVLKAQDTVAGTPGLEDGEVDIEYSLAFTPKGSLGSGMQHNLAISSEALANGEANLVEKANLLGSIESLTDITYDVSVVISDDKETQMQMAGTSNATITVTYQDL